MRGATNEVVVSFAHVYDKTRRNLNESAARVGFEWSDPSDNSKRALLARLTRIANDNSLRVSVCSQKSYIIDGVSEARCIDASRLSLVAGCRIVAKTKGNRDECLCSESRDIGAYDTCPHGCVYCYAVQNRDLAMSRFRKHDPDSDFLFAPDESHEKADRARMQPVLFDES